MDFGSQGTKWMGSGTNPPRTLRGQWGGQKVICRFFYFTRVGATNPGAVQGSLNVYSPSLSDHTVYLPKQRISIAKYSVSASQRLLTFQPSGSESALPMTLPVSNAQYTFVTFSTSLPGTQIRCHCV